MHAFLLVEAMAKDWIYETSGLLSTKACFVAGYRKNPKDSIWLWLLALNADCCGERVRMMIIIIGGSTGAASSRTTQLRVIYKDTNSI